MIRDWNRETDTGAIHALGNGNIVVYGFGPEITQTLAYPISADSFCQILLPEEMRCRSERLDGTAIWRHNMENGDVITDYIDTEINCFVRQVVCTEGRQMLLKVDAPYRFVKCEDDIWYFDTPNGVEFFYHHVDITPRRYIKVSGAAKIQQVEDDSFLLTFGEGVGSLYFSDTPEALLEEEKQDVDMVLARIGAYWGDFLKQMKPFPKWLAELAENVGIMIKCQQAHDGSVLAGHHYHLAYVRDQYGVGRGLMAMGFYREVEALMGYYKMYFDQYGVIHNAQSMGHHGVFHIHENDNVEVTGYLVIQAFQIYEHNHSEQFLQDMLPMIRWAIDTQIGEMRDGMLPFSGDETYIAGLFLPRFAMYDGSSEATMLLAESLRLYEKHTGDTRYNAVLQEIRDTYLKNFIRNGRLMTNIPERTPLSDYPAGRHGMCEDCGRCKGELKRNENYRYICQYCADHPVLPPRPFGSIELAAPKLMHLYIGSDLVPAEMMNGYLNEMVESFERDGKMPSGCADGNAVGYSRKIFPSCS